MQNIVDSHIAEAPEANDEGLVAIEYVVAAGLVAAGIAVVFTTGLWTTMQGKLSHLFDAPAPPA